MPEQSSLVQVTDTAALKQALDDHERAVVEFSAPWCERCREVASALEERSVPRLVVDVEAAPMLAYQYDVDCLPTLVRFENGEAVDRAEGVPADVGAFVGPS